MDNKIKTKYLLEAMQLCIRYLHCFFFSDEVLPNKS